MITRRKDYLLGLAIAIGLMSIDALHLTPVLNGLIGVAWIAFLAISAGIFILAVLLLAWHQPPA